MTRPETGTEFGGTDADEAQAAGQVVLKRWQSTLIAVGSVVLVYGLAAGVLFGGGAVIHTFMPKRHVDIFYAFHRWWVVGVLLGITVLLLLPPHPWAKRAIAPLSRDQPVRAGGTETMAT